MEKARAPRPDEMDDVDRLCAVCFGFHHEPSHAHRRRRAGRVPKETRIIVADGKPVSHVRIVYNHLSVHGAKVKVASFGGVCTHPDYRGRGIATELLDACVRDAAEAKAAVGIISGRRGLYRRAHAVPAGPVWEANVRAGTRSRKRSAVSVRQAGPDDWSALARLHQAEPVRFVRTARFYQQVASHRHHRGVWLVEHQGRPAAYLCLSRIWGTPRGHPVRALAEYAGARAALVDAFAPLCREAGLSEIRMAFPQFDEELAYLLGNRGLDLTPGTIPDHTFRLLNLPRLMQAMRPHVLARLSGAEARGLRWEQSEETCRFTFGGESKEVGLSQAGAIVLGGGRGPRVGGELGMVMSRVFPVPMPMPGLNYT
jgi:predicted N-acetyltransferase YhbS